MLLSAISLAITRWKGGSSGDIAPPASNTDLLLENETDRLLLESNDALTQEA